MFMFTSGTRLLVAIGFIVLLTSCQDQKTIPPEAYILNGVWDPAELVPEGGVKNIPSKIFFPAKFSWGAGRIISNTTMTIDIGAKKFFIPMDGLYTIEGIRMLGPKSFILSIYDYDPAFPKDNQPVSMRIDLVGENRLTTPGDKYMLARFPNGFIRLSGPGTIPKKSGH